MMKKIKAKDCVLHRVLDVGCILLLTSVFMDTYLWISRGYMIPCWTMAAMSAGVIAIMQVLKKLLR